MVESENMSNSTATEFAKLYPKFAEAPPTTCRDCRCMTKAKPLAEELPLTWKEKEARKPFTIRKARFK